jgi:hypothetical protein
MRFYDGPQATSLVSVTTILDAISKPSLYKWNGTQAARRATELDIPAMIKEHGKLKTVEMIAGAANQKRDNSAARGTRVHAAIERHLDGASSESATDKLVDARERGMFDGYQRFVEDYELEVVQQELAVCNVAHGWAGRYDVAGRCYGTFGETVVIDWKTGATGPHSTWALQLSAYANGDQLVDGGPLPVEVSKRTALAVRLYPGSYSTHWLDGKDGRPSLKELYDVFRCTRAVWAFEQTSRIWN